MEKIKRFFECYIPVTACNFKCEYCYIRQEHRVLDEMPEWQYSPEYIGEALNKERLGGGCYFSLCAGGETLLHPNMPSLIKNLLKQGHFVNVTNNGTISKAFDEILRIVPKEDLKRLHFAFSLHFIELKRKNMLERFATNVNKMHAAGCSYVVQMNMYDGYEPFLDEIKKFCIDNFGALPQLAATRREENGMKNISYMTEHTNEEYIQIGKSFNSPLWDFTNNNFMVKRHEFCYAGDWTSLLEITSGWWKKCYASRKYINIYEDISKPIPFEAVGRYCPGFYCVNSSHFLSLGAIPNFAKDITYAGLRNRKEAGWYNGAAVDFLSSKLSESNQQYSAFRKLWIDIKEPSANAIYRIKNKIRRMYDSN